MIQEGLWVSFQMDKGSDRFLNGRWFQLIFDIGVVSLLKLHKEDSLWPVGMGLRPGG